MLRRPGNTGPAYAADGPEKLKLNLRERIVDTFDSLIYDKLPSVGQYASALLLVLVFTLGAIEGAKLWWTKHS